MNYNTIIIIILIIVLIILYFDIYIIDLKDHAWDNGNTCKCYINIFNNLHLGDHIFNTYYFNFIKDFIEYHNIKINYYIDRVYHEQVKEFIQSDNITIKDFKYIGLNMSVLNLTYKNNYVTNLIYDYVKNNTKLVYDKFYISLFNETSIKLNIPLVMKNLIYDNPKLLSEYDKLSDKYKDIDILIINSIPRTMQVIYSHEKWNNFINALNNYKIVTTYKVNDIPCTLDDNLSVFKIGCISTHAKIVVAINTGPTSSLFNIYTLNNVKKMYIMENRVEFSHPKVINLSSLDEVNIDEIIKTLSI